MNIRVSDKNDIPKIVDLLKLSLGEGFVKKSEEIWNYKHQDNPFGTSHVLLAIDDEYFIGVRAFMQWRWQKGKELYKSFRAVDTSTHPLHQGKGIFKKLTLLAIDDVSKQNTSFIFNTPNDQSRPGYLKMGWEEVDKINVALIPTLVYSIKFLFSNSYLLSNEISVESLDKLCKKHNSFLEQKNVFFTPKSPEFLRWRYEINPMQQYTIFSNEHFYLAFYIKKHKYFNELRVAELITDFSKDIKHQIKNRIIKYAMKNNCILTSVSDKKLFTIKLFGKFGPKLTFRPVNASDDIKNLALNINNWSYSIGELELF